MGAIIIAAFQVWERQLGMTENAKAELQESQDEGKKMRRALYAEIASIYGIIEPLTKPELDAEVSAIVIKTAPISTYRWAKSQPNIFFTLPEAASIENVYRIIEFIHTHLNAPVFAKQAVRLCTGVLIAIEAALTKPSFHMDAKLFEQISPSVYKQIVSYSKEENRLKDLLTSFPPDL